MRIYPYALGLTLATATLSGCSREREGAPSGAAVRDSAGIEIVENRVDPEVLPILELPAEPDIRIGAVEGSEEQQLFQVQGAAKLADGRFAILNAGSHQVRVYDPTGSHLYSFGGAGDGPGEFGYPFQMIYAAPDTLLIWDSQTWRTTWFDLTGNVLAEDPGRTKYGARIPSGMFAEGGFALRSGLMLLGHRQGDDPPRGVSYRPPSSLVLLPRQSEGAVVLAEVYGGIEQTMFERAGRPEVVGLPFGKQSVFASGGNPPMVWAGDNDSFELRGYDELGNLKRVVRADLRPTPVTSPALAELKDRWRERFETFRDADRVEVEMRLLDLVDVPETMPHYSSVAVTRDGGLWVEAYRDDTDPSPRLFYVFDADGKSVGAVRTPPRFQPLDIGLDYVLAKVTSEFGVEFVALYELN